MKKFLKPAAFAVAFILVAFHQQAKAAVGPYVWYSSIATHILAENNFSLELTRQGNDEVICASIENRGRKNLSVTLNGPDGAVMDNFFTGRKFVKMSKTYNFSAAEEGLYTIVISDGITKIKRQIKLERVIAKPVCRLIVE
jgi:hypothetical protein